MGLQSENTVNGASLLVIDQACDNDQLLVSLSKNGTQWLSPVGWTDQQKVTLLDCCPKGETTEIDIPAEFANDIKTGDVLVLRCSELDLEKEIIWEASSVETRSAAEMTPAATGLAGGLFSRFKGSKAEVVEEVRSEAELRAEEADRAAQNYKAKMEAATAAKEEAQRKALDAAREAEAALKMEAERIAEMERAAKAFEEAERLKQDGLRRVEEERRAEEARLAEEARRIEEARKREIAAKKEAERKAALERYEAALDITRNEEVRLQSRLKELKRKAKSDAANTAVQAKDLKSRQGLLVTTEETATERFNSYETSASKLDIINADLAMLQTESETLAADRQGLSIRLSQADADYQAAQTEAEAAIARAEDCRSELEAIRLQDSDVSGKMSAVSEKLTSQSKIVAEASEKTQKLQVKYDAARAELAQANIEIEALEQALTVQAEADQNLRLEIEATQQAVEESQAREVAHCEAIAHLEAGGSPEEITEVEFETRSYEASRFSPITDEADIIIAEADTAGLKDRMMGRVRRSFTREKDAEISIDVEDVVMDAAETKTDPVLLAGLDDTPSFARRHGSSLMALGAVIGGIAILGGGYALNQSAKPQLSVKSSTPAPKQVLSTVTKIELPKIVEVKEMVEAKPAEIAAKNEASTSEGTTLDAMETNVISAEAIVASEAEEGSLVVKLAEVVDPTGFAFELPDMMPAVQPTKREAKPAAKKAIIETPAPKKIEIKKTAVVKTAAIKKVEPKIETDVNYPELTSDVQTRLSSLGFYAGEIDGLRGEATKAAIKDFKTVYSLPQDNKITGALLTELKRVERDQEAAQAQAKAEAEAKALLEAEQIAALEAQASIQVAEVAPAVEFYDTVQSVPSTPVVTDSLPAADPSPAYVAPQPEPEPVQVASISTVVDPVPTPAAQDVIVEAKMTRNASAKYPSVAERRSYFANVAIVVGYDIDSTGRATNITIKSNDNDERYAEAFEKEAMRAIEKLRYEPKTVNGTAAETKGRQKRIVFRGE